MNAAAIKARYGFLPQRPVFKFAGRAAATPVEQFKAVRCLLYQSCEGTMPNGRLCGELNRVAGEIAQPNRAGLAGLRKSPLGLKSVEPGALHASRARGDREVREVYPADDKEELTPLEMPPVRKPKDLRTYRVTWVIEVEADTPFSAARRARFYQTQPGTTVFEVSEVCLCAAERYGPPVTIDLTPEADRTPDD
jgi:hypothetical protein